MHASAVESRTEGTALMCTYSRSLTFDIWCSLDVGLVKGLDDDDRDYCEDDGPSLMVTLMRKPD